LTCSFDESTVDDGYAADLVQRDDGENDYDEVDDDWVAEYGLRYDEDDEYDGWMAEYGLRYDEDEAEREAELTRGEERHHDWLDAQGPARPVVLVRRSVGPERRFVIGLARTHRASFRPRPPRRCVVRARQPRRSFRPRIRGRARAPSRPPDDPHPLARLRAFRRPRRERAT
jgi:hypothetical protein